MRNDESGRDSELRAGRQPFPSRQETGDEGTRRPVEAVGGGGSCPVRGRSCSSAGVATCVVVVSGVLL